MIVRPIERRDYRDLLSMLVALWPKESTRDHGRQIRSILSGKPRSILPLTMFVAEKDGELLGFVEVGLRSHANGCDTARAVGFIEGWYVKPRSRRQGVGTALFAAAENWCKSHGCREMASDTWADHKLSVKAHTALGYAVEGTFVNFRKKIGIAALVLAAGLLIARPIAQGDLDAVSVRVIPASGSVCMADCLNGFGGGNVVGMLKETVAAAEQGIREKKDAAAAVRRPISTSRC